MKKILLLAIALAAIGASGQPYLVNLAIITALYALPALGLSLLMGYTGQISLGQAAFFGLGAYGSAIVSRRFGLDPWITIVLATAFSSAVAWAMGWVVFRLKGYHLAMATLALGIIVHVVFVEWRSVTGGQDGLVDVAPLAVFGKALSSDASFYPLAWIFCIGALVVTGSLVNSPAGLAMRVVAENEGVAGSIGIASDRLKRKVFALCGGLAGLGGALYAHWLGYISPGPFDVAFSVRLLMMVAVGGFAGIWSVLFGVFLIVLIGEALKPLGNADVVIFGLLLVVVVMYCPQGILHGMASAWRRLRPVQPPKASAEATVQEVSA